MNYSNDFIEPYGSLVFSNSTLVSAKNMNKLANQLTSGNYLISHHNHFDLYYSKSEMDTRYFSDTNRVNSDADMIDGSHLSDLIGGALPKYSVIAWESATIPEGYAIANGQIINGVATIDLRDYFVPIAGDTYSLGQTFGSNTFTISAKSIAIANHVLTISELPNHCHTYADMYYLKTTSGYYNAYSSNVTDKTDSSTLYSGYTGGDGGHNHTTGSSLSVNSNFINADNRPSYYALYFIEKVI